MRAPIAMLSRRHLLGASATSYAFALAGVPFLARAQAIQKNMRLIVGFPAGGTSDVLARIASERLRGTYAPVVLVENKAGAGGRIALANASSYDADGSVVFIVPCSLLWIYPHVYKKLGYDSERDFVPVGTMARGDFSLSVGPAVPESVKSLADFAAWAKANPKQAFFASPAAGATPHFVGVMFARAAGIELTHASYKGDAPGIQDLLGGQIAASVNNIGVIVPHLKGGKLRVLATSGAKRSAFTPDVPTFIEQGYKDVEAQEWFGFLAPSKTPPDVVNKLASAIEAFVKTPAVSQKLAELSFEPVFLQPAEFATRIKTERERWAAVVKASGFQLDE